jgi:hypothetical protein
LLAHDHREKVSLRKDTDEASVLDDRQATHLPLRGNSGGLNQGRVGTGRDHVAGHYFFDLERVQDFSLRAPSIAERAGESSTKKVANKLVFVLSSQGKGGGLLLTARMKKIADRLGSKLGTEVRILSITVDPEHDRPKQLLAYASAQGANVKGWLFFTGTPNKSTTL